MTSVIESPRTMKAAILVEQNHPLVIDEVELPEELEAGQVLVQLFYSGVCGAQLGEIEGVKGEDHFLPHLLGHEGSGRVLQAGPGVTAVQAGDNVVLHWRKGRGIQSATPRYRWRGAPLNSGWVTTFNEYAVVSENRVTPVPADFPLDLAPLFGCAVTTAFGVVNNDARLRPGESIVVLGAGGVGLSLIQVAAMVSATPIVAVDLQRAKLDLAKRLGATHCIEGGTPETQQELRALVGKEGADVVVENTGLPELIELAYELAGPEGRVVLVGVPRKGDNISIYSLPLHFGKVLTGSHGGSADPSVDIPRCIRLHRVGKLRLEELITERFAFDDINKAMDQLKRGQIQGRCLIQVSPPGSSG